jgi:hypothetical protein
MGFAPATLKLKKLEQTLDAYTRVKGVQVRRHIRGPEQIQALLTRQARQSGRCRQ